MLYLSSSLPALLSISSIFRSNKTVLPPSILPALRDTLADKLANELAGMAAPARPRV